MSAPTPVQSSVLVAPNRAFAGMLYDAGPNDIITLRNSDTVSIAFGAVVSLQRTSPVTDQDAILPNTSAINMAGIVVHTHNEARTFALPDGTVAGDLDAVGLVIGQPLNVLRRGRIWVQVRQAVVPGDRLFVCYAPDGTVYLTKGQVGNADVGGVTAQDATKIGVYLTKAAALGFAVVDVDFTNKQ